MKPPNVDLSEDEYARLVAKLDGWKRGVTDEILRALLETCREMLKREEVALVVGWTIAQEAAHRLLDQVKEHPEARQLVALAQTSIKG